MPYEKVGKNEPVCVADEVPFEIPDSWEWVRLSSLGANINDAFADGPFGSNLKKEHYTERKEVRLIQLSNIGEEGWRNENTKYTTYSHAETLSRSMVKPGAIVIAKMMPAGRAIIVPDYEKDYILSSDAVKFVPNNYLNVDYLVMAINSPAFRNQVVSEAHGVTRIRTSLGKLQTYLLPVPPVNEQRRIVDQYKMIQPLVKEYEKTENKRIALNSFHRIQTTSRHLFCLRRSAPRKMFLSRLESSRKTSMRASFIVGIILIMKRKDTRNAVLTMRYRLKYRKLGAGAD